MKRRRRAADLIGTFAKVKVVLHLLDIVSNNRESDHLKPKEADNDLLGRLESCFQEIDD